MPDLTDILKPIRGAAEEKYYTPGAPQDHWHMGAEDGFITGARHALMHPIILRTPEELDALPVGSVVLDGVDRAFVRSDLHEGWSWVAHDGYAATHDGLALAASGPVELIRLPKEDA